MSVINTQGTGSNYSGIEKYFYIQINIKNKQWVVPPANLLRFLYEEEAGNVAPVCEFDFLIEDTSVLKYLNEGNQISVTVGGYKNALKETDDSNISVPDKQQFSVTIVRLEISYNVFPYIKIYCSGIIGNYGYIATSNLKIIKQKNSLDAIRQVLNDNGGFTSLDIKTNKTPKDVQNWIQYNNTDASFISSIWHYSYMPNNVLFVGIDSTNRFIIRDRLYLLEQLTKKKYKYLFSNFSNDKDKKNLVQYNSILYSQSSTAQNLSYCYGIKKVIYDLNSGVEDEIESNIMSTGLSNNSKLNRNSSINGFYSASCLLTSNIHENYHLANISNLGNLLANSGSNLSIGFDHIFLHDLFILDPVYITVNDSDPQSQSSSRYEGGGYLVSKITRCIMNGVLSTTVICERDSIQEMTGELR